MGYRIYLSPPYMGGNEEKYVKEAFDTNWVAPYGPNINAFEEEMCAYMGIESAVALTSGTSAIHLALRWFDVQPGDHVFCQDFTFIGSCNPILYRGGIPVFIDSEDYTWNMSPQALERAFQWAKKNNKMPKAVIICDLYGESADWDNLLPICRHYGVPVVEDAAESVGTSYKGKKCGTFGDIGILSFNGNKIITTSGGGMALSHNKVAVEKMRFWSTQAREPVIWYEHKEAGYNYRMSNICAGIGRGQLEFLPEKLARRLAIHKAYQKALEGFPVSIKTPFLKGSSNHWLNMLVLQTDALAPEKIVTTLQNAQIEARPAWKPMHMQSLFAGNVFITADQVYTHSKDAIGQPGIINEEIFARSLCLPSGDALTEEQIQRIVGEIKSSLWGCEIDAVSY